MEWGWRDSSVVKSTYSFIEGLSSVPPRWGISQSPITPAQGDLMPRATFGGGQAVRFIGCCFLCCPCVLVHEDRVSICYLPTAVEPV